MHLVGFPRLDNRRQGVPSEARESISETQFRLMNQVLIDKEDASIFERFGIPALVVKRMEARRQGVPSEASTSLFNNQYLKSLPISYIEDSEFRAISIYNEAISRKTFKEVMLWYSCSH